MDNQFSLQDFFLHTGNTANQRLYKRLLTKYKKQTTTKKSKPIFPKELLQFFHLNLKENVSLSYSIIKLNMCSLKRLGIINYIELPNNAIILTFVANSIQQVPGLEQQLLEV